MNGGRLNVINSRFPVEFPCRSFPFRSVASPQPPWQYGRCSVLVVVVVHHKPEQQIGPDNANQSSQSIDRPVESLFNLIYAHCQSDGHSPHFIIMAIAIHPPPTNKRPSSSPSRDILIRCGHWNSNPRSLFPLEQFSHIQLINERPTPFVRLELPHHPCHHHRSGRNAAEIAACRKDDEVQCVLSSLGWLWLLVME